MTILAVDPERVCADTQQSTETGWWIIPARLGESFVTPQFCALADISSDALAQARVWIAGLNAVLPPESQIVLGEPERLE